MKWNLIDRVSTQVLYAVTGIVLALKLSTDDFGLVGALLVFQAFASLLVDSGFSYALLQRKEPSRLDYSTVLWFNIALATLLYAILFCLTPTIATLFQNDTRLIPLGRVIFLAIIFNATAIVQTNRLMKAMDVRMVAVSNSLGLFIGGIVGISLAVYGFGAWAIVWQTVVTAAIKSLVLWVTGHWCPIFKFSWTILRSYAGLGSRMLFTSFLNTVFLNIYSFFIGNRIGLSALGYYTQSDKWSKMGISSLSQVLTSSFVPALASVQDDCDRFSNMVSKMNRFTSYLLFPAMLGLCAMAEPIFHALFGTKWDPSITLFQILLFRGIFVVLSSLYSNYLLALGHGSTIVKLEIVRDACAILALAITFPYMNLSSPTDPVIGVRILLWGQLAATAISWLVALFFTVKLTNVSVLNFLRDMAPYAIQTLAIIPLMLIAAQLVDNAWIKLLIMTAVAIPLYITINSILGSKIQSDIISFIKK